MECLVEHDYKADEEDELTLTKGDRILNVLTMHDGWWEGTLNGKRGLFPDNFVKVITPHSTSTTIPSTSDVSKVGDGDAPKMRPKSGPGPHARRLKAIFSYAPTQEDELRLDVGDVIDFMDEIEEGWWKGELKGRVGIFPSNFVAELDKDNNVAQNGNVRADKNNEKEKVRNRESIIVKNKVIPDIIPSYRTQSKEEEVESAPKLPPKPVRETARCFYPYFATNDDELTLEEGDTVFIISKECEDEGWWRGELRGKIGVFPDNFVEIITPNSPTTSIPSVNQPKVTAQERTDDSKKETPNPVLMPSGNSVPDGSVGSKSIQPETRLPTQIKTAFGKDSPAMKGQAPLSPVSPVGHHFGGFSIKKDKESKSPLSTDIPKTDDLNLNVIERSEKLNHPTATRAKAPKRRPPSAIITREEGYEFGLMNGTGTTSLPMQSVKEPENPPTTPKNSNSQTFHVADGTSSKETSPAPQSTVNKPKQPIPWMQELKLKQDTKKSTGLGSPTGPAPITSPLIQNNNNISTVIVSPPAPASITTAVVALPIAKAPPLPAKPNIPTNAPVVVPAQPIEKQNPNIVSTTNQPLTPVSATAPKFVVGVLKKNVSPSTPTSPIHTHQSGGSGGFVTIEEHNQLKERVVNLENELELMRRQLKMLTEGDMKGLVV